MLNIKIDDPELEASLREAYGDDLQSVAEAFSAFVKRERIRRDVGVSITQLDAGEGIPLKTAMRELRAKYE